MTNQLFLPSYYYCQLRDNLPDTNFKKVSLLLQYGIHSSNHPYPISASQLHHYITHIIREPISQMSDEKNTGHNYN